MKKGIQWVLLVAFLLLPLAGCDGGSASSGAAAFETTPLEKGDLTASVVANGTVHPERSVQLSWKISGQVETVLIKNQTQVKSGQKLASLLETSLPINVLTAPADLAEAQKALDNLTQSRLSAEQAHLELVDAKEALDKATKALNNVSGEKRYISDVYIDGARAELMMAETEVDKAQNTYDHLAGRPDDDPDKAVALKYLSEMKRRRDQAYYNLNYMLGHPTDKEIERAQVEHALATARYEDAMRAYERVKNGVPADELAAAQARVTVAKATLEQAEITAPFDGFVTRLDARPGDLVTAGSVAVHLEDQSHFYVDAQVSEVDINTIQIGQVVTITFDAVYGQDYYGKVVEIGASGVAAQGVVNFPIRVELVTRDDRVKSGMTAVLRIQVQEVKDVLLVPNRAVRIQDGSRVVYIQKGEGLPQPVVVKLGVASDTMSQVLEGDIQAGDLVVLNPDMLQTAFGQMGN